MKAKVESSSMACFQVVSASKVAMTKTLQHRLILEPLACTAVAFCPRGLRLGSVSKRQLAVL